MLMDVMLETEIFRKRSQRADLVTFAQNWTVSPHFAMLSVHAQVLEESIETEYDNEKNLYTLVIEIF